MGIGEAIATFFNHVKRTALIFTDEAVCLLYGFNKYSKKYYGMLQNRPYGRTVEEFVKRYAVPLKFCDVYEIDSKLRFKRSVYYKVTLQMQIPLESLCDKHTKKLNYRFLDDVKDKNLPFDLVYNTTPAEICIELVSTSNNLSHNEIKRRNVKALCSISSRYSKHSATLLEYTELTPGIVINLVAHSGQDCSLILYSNTKNIKYKLLNVTKH